MQELAGEAVHYLVAWDSLQFFTNQSKRYSRFLKPYPSCRFSRSDIGVALGLITGGDCDDESFGMLDEDEEKSV